MRKPSDRKNYLLFAHDREEKETKKTLQRIDSEAK